MPLDFSLLEEEPQNATLDFSPLEQPEVGANLTWAGRPVTKQAIERVAKDNDTTPEAVMRLGTPEGRVEEFLSRSLVGSTALQLSEGATVLAENVAATGARGVAAAQDFLGVDPKGTDTFVKAIHQNRAKRQEFLGLLQKGGAVNDTFKGLLGEETGERAARVYNNTVQSLAEVGGAALAGPTAAYSYITGSAWENALADGENQGLAGGELVGYAGRSAAIEGGVTFLMGRAAKNLGLESLEESLSPAARRQIKGFLQGTFKEKLARVARELGGMTSEGVEEMLISGGQQLNEMEMGARDAFSWEEMLEAGASGVAGRGAVGAIKSASAELRRLEKKLPEITEGVRDAEVDLARGLNPFEVQDITDKAEFERQTGRKGTTQAQRDSYRDALRFFEDEMRRNGQSGHLQKMETEVRKLREEERQAKERAKQGKPPSKKAGRAGESQISTEPVAPRPQQTANDRATFSLQDFEERIRPEPKPEGVQIPLQQINPYILAPWETETRAQRRIRFLSRDLEASKETIKTLRQKALSEKRLTQRQQEDALKLVEDNVPPAERGKFNRRIQKATTPARINKLIDDVEKAVNKREHNLAVDMLRQSFKKAGNLRKEFADQVKEIRNSVDLKKFRNREAAEGLRAWKEENPQASLPAEADALIDRLEQQNVNNMTPDELLELGRTVESLAYQSAAKDKLIGELDSRSLDEAASRVVEDSAIAPVRTRDPASILADPKNPNQRQVADAAFHEVIERPEVSLLNFSPELNELTYGEVRRGREDYHLRKKRSEQLISDTLNSVGLDHQGTMVSSLMAAMPVPAVRNRATKLQQWLTDTRVVGDIKLDRDEAWGLVLAAKDATALRNMQEAGWEFDEGGRVIEKVTPEVMQQLKDFVGPEGEVLADVVFNHLNGDLIDGVNEASLKNTGRPLTEKRDVVPLQRSSDEYESFFRSGSVHSGMAQAATDSYGHLRHRAGSVFRPKTPKGVGGFGAIMNHIDRMHRFASYAVPARNVEMVLNHPRIKGAVTEKNGEFGYDQIVDAVRSEVAGFSVPRDRVTQALTAINHRVAGALVSLKLPVIMSQGLDVLNTMAYEDNGISDYFTGANVEGGQRGPTAVVREMKEVLSAISGEWNHRYESNNYAHEFTFGLSQPGRPFLPASITELAASPIQTSEQMQVAPAHYLAAKQQARRELGLAADDFNTYMDDPRWTKIVADSWGRRMVRGSTSSHGMELSGALRWARRNPVAGLALNFTNQPSKIISTFTMAEGKLMRGDHKGAVQAVSAGMAGTLLYSALRMALSQSEGEKEMEASTRFFSHVARNTVGLLPFAGEILSETVVKPVFGMRSFQDNPILVADLAADALRGATEIGMQIAKNGNDAEDQKKWVKAWLDVARGAGPFLQLPTPALIDITQRVKKGAVFTGLQPSEKKTTSSRTPRL